VYQEVSMEGIVNLLKTPGMTSHDCINAVRRLLGEKRVGHTGTLDPMASGVLPVCVGKATRLVEYSLDYKKQYRAEMIIGVTSDTQDVTGKILTSKNASGVTEEKVLKALEDFTGEMEQVVPAYSAVKHQGKKLYELARKGASIPKKNRNIVIYKISLFRYYPAEDYPRVIFDVVCSKGTYIRTICSDLGDYLGPGAVMSFLSRTASGPFLLEESVTLEEIEASLQSGNLKFLKPMGILVNHLPCIELKSSAVKYIKNGTAVNGRYFKVAGTVADNSLVRLENAGRLVGIGILSREDNGACLVKPKKVLI
jgi:tRNA pseudouridine55 synthase